MKTPAWFDDIVLIWTPKRVGWLALSLVAGLCLAPGGGLAQQGAQAMRAPTAPLPAPDDLGGVHAYIEGLAFDPDEARAMIGFDVLVAGGEPYAQSLSQVFLNADGDARCRWVAGQALGRLGSAPAQAAIERGMTDSLPLARLASIQALPHQRPPKARALLEGALKDPAAVVRAAAADSLGQLGDPRAAAALISAYGAPVNEYKGTSLFVRANILDALAALRAQSGVEVMLRGVQDTDPDVQDAARRALMALSGLPAAPPGTSPEVDRWRAVFGLPSPAASTAQP